MAVPVIPGEFDAHDEMYEALTAQPYRIGPMTPLGPEPDYTQPVTCCCPKTEVSPYTGRDTVVPCVEEAGPDGLCPACAAHLCTRPAQEATAA